MMQDGWLHIMTNRPNGTLYVGATTDLVRRAWEHRVGVADGFTKQYDQYRLAMPSGTMTFSPPSSTRGTSSTGLAGESSRLILNDNPGWDDLYNHLA
jgi:putative endonuclease